jgi:hypothetical protein
VLLVHVFTVEISGMDSHGNLCVEHRTFILTWWLPSPLTCLSYIPCPFARACEIP